MTSIIIYITGLKLKYFFIQNAFIWEFLGFIKT